jgi:hypothetical protein
VSASVLEDSSLERLRALLLQEGGLMASLVDSGRADDSIGAARPGGSAASDGLAPLDGPAIPGGPVRPGGPAASEAPEPLDGPAHPDGLAPFDGPAQLAASGPRVNGRGADYELLIETIYEGYLLHYHAPRVVRPPEADLGLLAGDRLYALGLARLVKLGDVEAVAELADVITLSALARGAGNPELAEAVWLAGARAVGWGASPQHDRAKALTRSGSPAALEAMRSAASIASAG